MRHQRGQGRILVVIAILELFIFSSTAQARLFSRRVVSSPRFYGRPSYSTRVVPVRYTSRRTIFARQPRSHSYVISPQPDVSERSTHEPEPSNTVRETGYEIDTEPKPERSQSVERTTTRPVDDSTPSPWGRVGNTSSLTDRQKANLLERIRWLNNQAGFTLIDTNENGSSNQRRINFSARSQSGGHTDATGGYNTETQTGCNIALAGGYYDEAYDGDYLKYTLLHELMHCFGEYTNKCHHSSGIFAPFVAPSYSAETTENFIEQLVTAAKKYPKKSH